MIPPPAEALGRALPAPLELLAIRIPTHTEIVFANSRAFDPAVEFWSTFTVIRIVWAIPVDRFFETRWPSGLDGDGKLRHTKEWSLSPLRNHEVLTITTEPLPATVSRITLFLGDEPLTVRMD